MFSDRLTTKLSLTIGNATFAVLAGSVREVAVDLSIWGFSADIVFYVSSEQSEDEIFEPFTGSDLIGASFTLTRMVQGDSGDDVAGLAFSGYAVARSVIEVVGEGLSGAPVVGRRYTITVLDAAQAFWKQHRPVVLYAGSSMQQLIEANRPVGVSITYDWSILQTSQDVLCVCLQGEDEASFYDFIVWFVDRNQGVLELDARAAQYRIGGKKARPAPGTDLDPGDVAELRVRFPEPPRFAGRVLNGFANAPTTKDLANAASAQGVRRDVLLQSPLASEADQRAQVETSRLTARPPGIEVAFQRCPESVPQPGDVVTVGDGFSTRTFPAGSDYRVVRHRLRIRHDPKAAIDFDDTSALYEVDMSIEAEDKGSRVAWLPPFKNPRRALRVEGKVVSGGSTGERPWSAMENEDSSLWAYKVMVPVFNQEIPVPFVPTGLSGHFFFPAYKDQRILVDIDFDRATLAGFLEWADEARLPIASQGNQLVLGPKSANGTIIKHDYEDGIPVLTIQRQTGGETALLQMGDGVMTISLAEQVTASAALPVYDVSPQVDAAKDAVTAQVGGSITEVTTQLETSSGQVGDAVDATADAVEQEVAGTERQIVAQLDALDAELQGMASDSGAAVGTVQMACARFKAQLEGAAGSLDDVKASLTALQARVDQFAAKAQIDAKNLAAAVDDVDQGLLSSFDAISVDDVRSHVKEGLEGLKSDLDAIGPQGDGGPFAPIRALRGDVDSFTSDVDQATASVDGTVQDFLGAVAGDWAAVDSAVASLPGAIGASVDAQSARIGARCQAVLAQPNVAASVRSRVSLVRARAQTVFSSTRSALEAALDPPRSAAQAGRQGLESAAKGAGATATASTAAIAEGAGALSKAVDQAEEAAESAAATATATAQQAITRLDQAVSQAMDAIPPAIDAAKATLRGAVDTAKEALDDAIGAVASAVSTVQTAVSVPLSTAVSLIDTAETTAKSTVSSAASALDDASSAAEATISGFVTTFQSLVDGGSNAIDGVRDVVSGLRQQIMPPIDALEDLTSELESLLQTGVNLLTGFLAQAQSALGAIPAVELPMPMVAPALQAIQAALDAAMPVIQEAADGAASQIQSLATTLLGQVQAAENAAVQAVGTFASSISSQVDAILPPIREQLAAVQTQIDDAVDAAVTQLGNATQAACDAVTAVIQAAAAQVQSVVDQVSARMDTAEADMTALVQKLAGEIDAQRAALVASAEQLVAGIQQRIASAEQAFDAGAASIGQQIQAASAALTAQVNAAVDPLTQRLGALRQALDQATPQLQAALAPLRERSKTLAAQAMAALPSQASIDAASAAAAAPLDASLDAIGAPSGGSA